MKMDCGSCKYKVTPKGKQCYTMTRLLTEYIGDEDWTPLNVFGGMRYVRENCKRYKGE